MQKATVGDQVQAKKKRDVDCIKLPLGELFLVQRKVNEFHFKDKKQLSRSKLSPREGSKSLIPSHCETKSCDQQTNREILKTKVEEIQRQQVTLQPSARKARPSADIT